MTNLGAAVQWMSGLSNGGHPSNVNILAQRRSGVTEALGQKYHRSILRWLNSKLLCENKQHKE